MPLSKIGPFNFRALSRPPALVMRSLSLVAVAGVDGHAIWDDGARGQPFGVRSEAVTETLASGRQLLREYNQLLLEPPVEVRWAGEGEAGHRYKVLHVDCVDEGLRRVIYGIGPHGEFGAVLTCQWVLLPMDANLLG